MLDPESMSNDKIPQMDPGFYPMPEPQFFNHCPELPAMIDAACDILLASGEENSVLVHAVDEDTFEELVEEAAQFLITIFRERREWTERLQQAQEMINRRFEDEVNDGH